MQYLGIEIGGTKLQVGLGDGRGHLAHLHRVPAEPHAGAAGIRAQIEQAVADLLKQTGIVRNEIIACGLGFGGPVDDRTEQTITSHQVEGWDHFPLAEWAREKLGIPAVIGNDADVAGLAEALCGAGQGCNPVFYMNIGSGIGGALILEGRIHRGTGLGAGEVGHLWSDHEIAGWEARENWSILEKRSSGWALQRAGNQPDVQALLLAVEQGEPLASTVWRDGRRRLAVALSHVIALLCPQRIVLGGGVALAAEALFLEPLRQEVAEIVFRPFANCYDIVPAGLGELVVVHGALALARQHFPTSI